MISPIQFGRQVFAISAAADAERHVQQVAEGGYDKFVAGNHSALPVQITYRSLGSPAQNMDEGRLKERTAGQPLLRVAAPETALPGQTQLFILDTAAFGRHSGHGKRLIESEAALAIGHALKARDFAVWI